MPRHHSTAIAQGTRARFLVGGLFSLLAWVLLQALAPGASIPWQPEMIEAARAMDSALAVVGRHCQEAGIPVERSLDPNGTCLVGPELSPLMTSLGQLEAKRTTTVPDVAGLLVHLLRESGVGLGDRVAIGASGSFPGLMVAALAAVRALNAEAVTILSLGASSFGATRPDFHLLDLHRVLESSGFAGGPPAAVSLGGASDMGGEFDPAFRDWLRGEIASSGVPLAGDPDLRVNVGQRMELYGSPQVFVNIGGAEANLGVSPRILQVPPGLVRAGPEGQGPFGDYPPETQRGVLFEMLVQGAPVIHLLHVRGLALRYGLPWDPLPLPPPASTRFRDAQAGKGFRFWLLTVGYVTGLLLAGLGGRWGKAEGVRKVEAATRADRAEDGAAGPFTP